MAESPDTDLTAARRVLAALIDGIRRFQNDIRVVGADMGTT